ncbi:helix-turn-helix transcriptional regulator [Paratissierella segnis]|uniref:Helix-turn-helix transcriptional regulator n=1 Tax=Paratissierella segnis TaxID=2763679 RepID=A0A926EX54_9FIRM|nr:helix-turn-helix transcriptional regulator [Paratissierella segnis]MBC8588049.1 helix-turn-helix transcriptional regulator [Paratissierella segnis]
MKKGQYSIKELRARKNISQEELARLVNLTTRTIVSYENNISALRNASYNNIEKIAKSLDVEISEIFLG